MLHFRKLFRLLFRYVKFFATFVPNYHNPPHFHIRYGDYQAIITIHKGIVKGEIPSNALKQVFHWMELHKQELVDNWNRLQNGEEAQKIEPLK